MLEEVKKVFSLVLCVQGAEEKPCALGNNPSSSCCSLCDVLQVPRVGRADTTQGIAVRDHAPLTVRAARGLSSSGALQVSDLLLALGRGALGWSQKGCSSHLCFYSSSGFSRP